MYRLGEEMAIAIPAGLESMATEFAGLRLRVSSARWAFLYPQRKEDWLAVVATRTIATSLLTMVVA
jgi:hypothetical protein